MVQMSDEFRKNIEEAEAHSRFPTGIGRITRGECPMGHSPLWVVCSVSMAT